MKSVNKQIEGLCSITFRCTFIDITSQILKQDSQIREELFTKDKVHFIEKGIMRFWKNKISEKLKKQNR